MAVEELTDASFEAEVLQSDLPVLVDFWAAWCGPCRKVAPVVEELATAYDGKLKCFKMDINVFQTAAQKYGIRSIPALLVFKDGEEVGRSVGAVTKAELEELVQDHV